MTIERKFAEILMQTLSFICMFCRLLFVLLYFFLLTIVLSVLLRYTDSDCPFGIFKLFLTTVVIKNIKNI